MSEPKPLNILSSLKTSHQALFFLHKLKHDTIYNKMVTLDTHDTGFEKVALQSLLSKSHN